MSSQVVCQQINVEVLYHLTEEQIEDLYLLYQSEWWTKGRQLLDVRRMVQYSNWGFTENLGGLRFMRRTRQEGEMLE